MKTHEAIKATPNRAVHKYELRFVSNFLDIPADYSTKALRIGYITKTIREALNELRINNYISNARSVEKSKRSERNQFQGRNYEIIEKYSLLNTVEKTCIDE